MPEPQTYKNHGRSDPMFHFTLVPALILNIVVVSIWYAHHRYQHVHSGPWAIFMSVVMLYMALLIRAYSLKVQDRVIRTEERIRLASLCTASELTELSSLTMKQYIALRFASDIELPDLARRAVRENLTPKQIKQAIMSWRPDYERV